MWYQHDGCPAHYSEIAREALDRDYTNRWIDRNGPITWPVRSPDLTPLDFFLWDFLKDKEVYQNVPTTPEDMKARIRNACREINRNTIV